MKWGARVAVMVSLAGGVAAASPGVGASELFDFQTSCTTVNCSAIPILGEVFRHTVAGHVGHKPWVGQVYTGGNECLRIEVLAPAPVGAAPDDLEAILTCPNGTTWVDDDSGRNNAPLIKAIVGGRSGWCTLTIGHFGGENVESFFDLRYGRYPSNNAQNCSNPTRPVFSG